MKNSDPKIPTADKAAYEEYEKQLAVENEYKTYLSYCMEEGYIEPEEAQDIVEKKDWDRVEYMMSYGLTPI